MATQNAELITQTAEVLLTRIQEVAKEYGGPSDMKELAEAFAFIAQHDTPAKREPARAYIG